MCGIAGFVDFNKNSGQNTLEKMTCSLEHRGPDGDGYYLTIQQTAEIGLGHRRLSIIDLSNHSAQPMHLDSLSITFNGEIYNYQEIKDELIRLGHSFVTTGDTEVILHAYRAWGVDMVQRFTGMFAFVILDKEKQEIIAFRDRAGVKPFYYYFKNGLFLFGSELKSFHGHPGFEKNLDMDAVAAFFRYGNVPAPHCIFQNAKKLGAGHYLRLNLENKSLTTQQYWNVYDYYNKPKLNISLPEAVEETEHIFQKAFNYRMVADVPVGVFLSGGYDSSCVTALLQKDRTDKLKTFTIGTTDKKSNEAPFAREIATRLGTDHTEYYCTAQEAKEIIPVLPDFYDEPFADSSAIPTILVSRLARERVTVALSADGGDELFAGYTKYQYLMGLQKKLSGVPKPARAAAKSLMDLFPVQQMPGFSGNHVKINKYQRLKALLKDPSIESVFSAASQLFTKNELDELLVNHFQPLKTGYDSKELKPEFYDPLTYMMAIDYQTYLADDIMQKVDRASMSIGLESREPLLDQHITEWTAQLPLSLKINNGQGKFLLKQIVHKYLPKEIMERPKTGFTIPVREWLKTDFKTLALTFLSDKYIQDQRLFSPQYVKKLRQGFFESDNVPTEKIWYLLMFQLWYQKWMIPSAS